MKPDEGLDVLLAGVKLRGGFEDSMTAWLSVFGSRFS